jgi:hypothetical protein
VRTTIFSLVKTQITNIQDIVILLIETLFSKHRFKIRLCPFRKDSFSLLSEEMVTGIFVVAFPLAAPGFELRTSHAC